MPFEVVSGGSLCPKWLADLLTLLNEFTAIHDNFGNSASGVCVSESERRKSHLTLKLKTWLPLSPLWTEVWEIHQ